MWELVEIREVKTGRDLRRFVSFPHALYAGNKYWVPPLRVDELKTLRREKNPAFEHCEARYWLAYKDGRVAGRIAGIINHQHSAKWGQDYIRFGWLDFVDDAEVSRALVETVEAWARERGMTGIHGPLGFCDLDREGLLVEGFAVPGTMVTIYNHPYYPAHLERLGYAKDVDWVEYELRVPAEVPESVERVSRAVMKRLKLRLLDARRAKDLKPYARAAFALINEAYKDLYGFVPLSDRQIEAFTKQYFGFISPDYTKIILDEQGALAGIGIAMPSLSNALRKSGGRLFPLGFLRLLAALRRNDCLDLYLVAVRPDLQKKGVNALLMNEITKACIKNGITRGESNPELETNENVQAFWKHYEARQHKRRRVYLKKLA
ncbi:MAG: GNAT family N-acetyltransferase [Patescibacteria group bacterium]